MPRIVFFCLLILLKVCHVQAQIVDPVDSSRILLDDPAYHFKYEKLIIPTVFIGYGVASLISPSLKELNSSTRYETREHITVGAVIDNYMQYAPAAAVYGLNLFGVKGKHNLKDRTIIYLTSQVYMGAMVIPTKRWVGEIRPDGSNTRSFPSGHTATAFSSAQFLFHEYKDSNFWLSISGYPLAAATGIYRIFNDRHWVGDVVAGAGIGILSTELAYWTYPMTSQWFHKKDHNSTTLISPYYQDHALGIHLAKVF